MRPLVTLLLIALSLCSSAGEVLAFDLAAMTELRENSYRKCQQCDLSGADLRGADLRRAQLQGVDLRGATLDGAQLSFAQLQGANLAYARLQGADLGYAQLQGANLRHAELRNAELEHAQLVGADFADARLENVNMVQAQLPHSYLHQADLRNANLLAANLEGAQLVGAQLQDANLQGAQLENANLQGAQLPNANLSDAQLWNADLRGVQLQDANLQGAQLRHADLRFAQLQGANLFGADLRSAVLTEAYIEGAVLAFADLTEAVYAPVSPPPHGSVDGLRGLSTVVIPEHDQRPMVSGLVSLRELLLRTGHRDAEREATFSIERARTRTALAAWPRDPLRAIEGALRLVFFEWTTGYGLYPGRALRVLLGLVVLFSFAYLPAVGRADKSRRSRGALYRIWPGEWLIDDNEGLRLVTYGEIPRWQRAERLEAKWVLGRYGYALYFSVLSAFHIGWRELSFGTWLARLQLRDYALRAQGWPRLVSGAQSLISVYLVAIWALTYFGRPFQ